MAHRIAQNRKLTDDEIKQVDAFVKKLTAPPPEPTKDGNEHWLTAPHGAADVFSPHRVPAPTTEEPESEKEPGEEPEEETEKPEGETEQ